MQHCSGDNVFLRVYTCCRSLNLPVSREDVIDKTQNLEMVLLPVKVKLPKEDEYELSTGNAAKELSCK